MIEKHFWGWYKGMTKRHKAFAPNEDDLTLLKHIWMTSRAHGVRLYHMDAVMNTAIAQHVKIPKD